jgi:hypothetical protein
MSLGNRIIAVSTQYVFHALVHLGQLLMLCSSDKSSCKCLDSLLKQDQHKHISTMKAFLLKKSKSHFTCISLTRSVETDESLVLIGIFCQSVSKLLKCLLCISLSITNPRPSRFDHGLNKKSELEKEL